MPNNVVSLDLAKRLKLAGFPQDGTMAAWYRADGNDIVLPRMIMSVNYNWNLPWHQIGLIAAAVTAQEIADEIETNVISGSLKMNRAAPDRWTAYLHEYTDPSWSIGPTISEALGELYLKLQEQPHGK